MIKKIFSLLLLIALSTNLYSVKINNQELNDILKHDEVLTYTTNENNIILKVEKDNITIGSLEVNNLDEIKSLNKDYQEIKSKFKKIESKDLENKIILKSDDSYVYLNNYVVNPETVIMSSDKIIDIQKSILDSKNIYFSCKSLSTDTCFIDNVDFVQIEPVGCDSVFKVIKFLINNEKTEYPKMIQSSIKFDSNEEENYIIVLGSNKLEILFNDGLIGTVQNCDCDKTKSEC